MRRCLVVANQTLGGPALTHVVQEWLLEEQHSFYIVVPATPPKHRWTYTEGEAVTIARARLQDAIERFRAMGAAEVDGEVGDARPLDAISDALRTGTFDAILISTLPPGRSRWLKLDLPARARAEFGLPVVHVVSNANVAPLPRRPGEGFDVLPRASNPQTFEGGQQS